MTGESIIPLSESVHLSLSLSFSVIVCLYLSEQIHILQFCTLFCFCVSSVLHTTILPICRFTFLRLWCSLPVLFVYCTEVMILKIERSFSFSFFATTYSTPVSEFN